MKWIAFFLFFIVLLSNNSFGQNLFKEIQIGSEIYGNWIADWSFLEHKNDYCIYQFNENDTLYIIRNEKLSHKFPFRFYEYNDSIYLSLYDNGIHIKNRGHFDAMRSNLNVFSFEKDSFSLFRGYYRKKNVFFKSKAELIPIGEFSKELKGSEYDMVGAIGCGFRTSSQSTLAFNFVSDSTCTIATKVFTKTDLIENVELVSIDTIKYKIQGDILIFENQKDLMFEKQMLIKQRIGLKKNKLVINGLRATN